MRLICKYFCFVSVVCWAAAYDQLLHKPWWVPQLWWWTLTLQSSYWDFMPNLFIMKSSYLNCFHLVPVFRNLPSSLIVVMKAAILQILSLHRPTQSEEDTAWLIFLHSEMLWCEDRSQKGGRDELPFGKLWPIIEFPTANSGIEMCFKTTNQLKWIL